MQEKEKRGGLKSIELCRMLAKGRTKTDKSLAFAKKTFTPFNKRKQLSAAFSKAAFSFFLRTFAQMFISAV